MITELSSGTKAGVGLDIEFWSRESDSMRSYRPITHLKLPWDLVAFIVMGILAKYRILVMRLLLCTEENGTYE